MNKDQDFMADNHVTKALHGLAKALEQAAKDRGTEVKCLFIACGMADGIGGTALLGCTCDDCIAKASGAIRRAAARANIVHARVVN